MPNYNTGSSATYEKTAVIASAFKRTFYRCQSKKQHYLQYIYIKAVCISEVVCCFFRSLLVSACPILL